VIVPGADDDREACDRRPAEVRATWTLPPVDTSPGRARQLLGDRLHLWGCPPRFVADAVQLVNELVSNTVEHAATEARVAVHLEDGVLLCSVRDHSTAPPVPRPPGEGRGGFGLLLVDAIARGWGWIPHPDGKTVWVAAGPPDEPLGPARPTPSSPLPRAP
jgi:anti-sigma regulatory factor (Ser/Thr protein kinase)